MTKSTYIQEHVQIFLAFFAAAIPLACKYFPIRKQIEDPELKND